MKRTVTSILTLLVVAAWCAAPAFSQTSFSRNWEFSDNQGTKPAYLSNARALAWGMVDDGTGTMQEVVLVSTGDAVEILDAADGSDIGDLDVSGVADVSRDVNDIAITPDNVVIACNETNNPFLTSSDEPFKCYRWDALDETPTEVISYVTPDQDGDGQADPAGRLITVTGRADDNSLTITTASSNLGKAGGDPDRDNVYRFTTSDNGQSFTPEAVDRTGDETTQSLNESHQLGNGAASFIYKPAASQARLYAADGTFDQIVMDGVISNFSHSMQVFSVDNRDFLTVFNWEAGGAGQKATLVDITAGLTSAIPEGSTPSMGDGSNNSNGTGDVDVRINSDNTVTFFVLATNTGIASYTTDSALPVELASFEADRDGDNVALRWETLSETGNSGFDIERSIDGSAFTKVGFEPGQGTTTESTNYRFVDNSVPYGVSEVTYRLRQVDVDGDETLSDARTITFTPSSVSLVGSVPNPVVSKQAEIRYELPKAMNVRLSVYDLLGRQVAVLADGEQMAKQHRVRFDASTLASGTYFIRLETDRGATTSKMTIAR